jgi:Tfp pilus assembly PilM family ATPase
LNNRDSQLQPIGLDLGADSIKMLQLELRPLRQDVLGTIRPPSDRAPDRASGRGSGGGGAAVTVEPHQLAVVAAATATLAEAGRSDPQRRMALAAGAVRRMLAEQPFVGRAVVAALPRSAMHVRTLRLSALPTLESNGQPQLDAATRSEIASLFPFDLSRAIVRCLYAGQVHQGSDTGHELIVLASPAAAVEAFLAELDGAGVAVTSLDCQPNALFRSIERFGRRGDDALEAQMIVDIGTRQTQVIIGRGRTLNFCKTIDVGGLHLLEAVAAKLGITLADAKSLRQRLLEESREAVGEPAGAAAAVAAAPIPRRGRVRQAVADATRRLAEELGRELSMCLRYHAVAFRGRPPRRVRIVGGDADDPQLMAAFASVLTLPVEPAQPLASLDTARMRPADRAGSASQWALAAGLAMRLTEGYFANADGPARVVDEPARAQPPRTAPIADADPAPIPLVQPPEVAVA